MAPIKIKRGIKLKFGSAREESVKCSVDFGYGASILKHVVVSHRHWELRVMASLTVRR